VTVVPPGRDVAVVAGSVDSLPPCGSCGAPRDHRQLAARHAEGDSQTPM